LYIRKDIHFVSSTHKDDHAVTHIHCHYHFRVLKEYCEKHTKPMEFCLLLDLNDKRLLLPCFASLTAELAQRRRCVTLRPLIPKTITNNNKETKIIIQTMTSVDIARHAKQVQYLSVRDIVLLFSITLTTTKHNFLLIMR